jgi:DNA-binding XRE family transcriptional regulator
MTKTEKHQNYRCLTPQEIGTAVVMFRRMAGMKQFTLAHEAGVTERTVQRIENGDKVNDESLRRIAKAFRMEETLSSGRVRYSLLKRHRRKQRSSSKD